MKLSFHGGRDTAKRCHEGLGWRQTAAWLLLSIGASVAAAEEPYRWPLDLPRVLTSSFGEYRPGRFHAGIDLRTGGVGIPVYAAADGYVSRLRCSPYGYGKAVYLKFSDGNSAVYGHLDDFAGPMRAYVRAKQHEAQSYTVDLTLEASQFPVKKGDLIAYSGQTGIGAPHLHYELRGRDEVPINPRLLGVTWPDVAAPVIKRVAIIPGDAESMVGGGFEPVLRTVSQDAEGQHRLAAVHGSGRVGFGVEVEDPGEGGYTLGVHTLEAIVDGKPLFTVTHDHISYDTNKSGAVAYHPMLKDEGRFLLAYRWPGNNSESYAHNEGEGWLRVGEAPLEVMLRATDFAGNACEVRVPLVTEEENESDAPAAATSKAGQVEWQYWGSYLALKVRFDGAEPEAPVLEYGEDKGKLRQVKFRRLGDATFAAAVSPEGAGLYTFHVRHPRVAHAPERVYVLKGEEAGSAILADTVTVLPSPGAAYGMLPVRVESTSARQTTLWPAGAPINAALNMELAFDMPYDERPGAKVYRAAGKSWSRVDTQEVDEGLYEVHTQSLGTFALKQDTTAPEISNVSPPEDYVAKSVRPKIEATVKDDLSGVDKVEARLDGKWLLMAYDPERERIFWERDEDMAAGEHEIELRVTDAAGNVARETRKVVVPEGAEKAKPERP